ncbi:armadillo-type protein [Mycena alexandri]|uniref:Armadillo-type protein n=1 Tax=Mycena alexandri TaxID=1745969 RepID=A0AAD6RXL9_9AGAR|nr:armadillo-type protein [Mycena alexandri]
MSMACQAIDRYSLASSSLMPPLTRQRTPQSLYSEWSRSSLGATISIHALAKPLMKVMYHRAVLDLIKRQQGIPLSAETMQIYESYLGSKYVAETTKTFILGEILKRALVEAQAHIISDFLGSYDIHLDSKNVVVRRCTTGILALLAFHSSTCGAVITVQPCARLTALLGDGNMDVVEGACHALSQIARDLDGARAVVEAGVLDFIPELLESTNVAVRRWTTSILGKVAFHSSTQEAVVAIQPSTRLVALLGDGNVDIVESACYTLSQIARDLDGARAVVKAGALDFIPELLESTNVVVRKQTSWLLGNVALHSSTRGAVVAIISLHFGFDFNLAIRSSMRLVALLGDGNVAVIEGACYALSKITRNLHGARAVVEAGALDFIPELLESTNVAVREWSSWLLGEVAFHSSTRGAVVAIQPSTRLVPLLGDGNVDVVEGACYALSKISLDLDGARAVVEAGVLDFIPELLDSTNVVVRRWTTWILGQLALYSSTRGAVVAILSSTRLVALLGDGNVDVVECACCAIYQIARDLDGTRAVVEAGVLDFIPELLESTNVAVRQWTTWILGQLALYSSTRGAVVAILSSTRLVALLGDGNVEVVAGACYALACISHDLDGTRAVVEAGALDFIPELLESTNVAVRQWTTSILGKVAFHSLTRGAVVAIQPSTRLVALLSDGNVDVVKAACYAIYHISRDLDGARAVVEAGALDFIPELLESTNVVVRKWTSQIVAALGFHSSTRGAVVAIQPSTRLVALLGDSNVDVVEGACYALSKISWDLDGARAVVEAGVLDFIPELLESTNVAVQERTSWILSHLAFHSSTRGAVVAIQPSTGLVALLGDGNVDIVESACYALSKISWDLDGARAVVEAGVLDFIPELLESTSLEVQRWASCIVAELGFHLSTRGAVVAIQPSTQLVALLRDGNVDVVEGACYALANISHDLDGARAVVEAGVLDFIPELLESTNVAVRKWTSRIVAELGFHSSTRGAVVAIQPSTRLVALLG